MCVYICVYRVTLLYIYESIHVHKHIYYVSIHIHLLFSVIFHQFISQVGERVRIFCMSAA